MHLFFDINCDKITNNQSDQSLFSIQFLSTHAQLRGLTEYIVRHICEHTDVPCAAISFKLRISFSIIKMSKQINIFT